MIKRMQAIVTAVLICCIYLWFPATVAYAESTETQISAEHEDAANPEGDNTGVLSDDNNEGTWTEGFIAPKPENAFQQVYTMDDLGEASEPETPVEDEEPESEEPVQPDIIVTAARIDCQEDAFVLECHGDASALALENVAYAQYGRFDFVPCEIIWRYDEFDNITPGRHMIVGDIVLPPGYAFENEPLTVQSSIIVYDPVGTPTERLASCIYSTEDKPILIPRGAGRETLQDYFTDLMDEAILITESGDYFYCPVALDLDAIDTSVEGVYYPVVIDLPGGLTFGGQEYFMIGVHVIPDDVVTLSAVKWGSNWYSIKWLYPASDPIMWVSVDEGDWFLPDAWSESSYNMYGCLEYTDDGFANELLLFYNNLPAGHIYKFQIQYDGVSFSNVIELDLINYNLPRYYFDNGGDRNGGDRDENTLPATPSQDNGTSAQTNTGNQGNETSNTTGTGNQNDETSNTDTGNQNDETPNTTDTGNSNNKAPSTQQTGSPGIGLLAALEIGNLGNGTPTAQQISNPGEDTTTAHKTGNLGSEAQLSAPIPPATTAEYTDAQSVTVSGQRLAVMMAANPEYVSFLSADLRASIPTAFLESLNIAPSDFFTVTLYRPQEMIFIVSFAVNDIELSYSFPQPFIVSLPWDGGYISCEGEDGETIDAELDTMASRASFALNNSGTYTMTAQAAEPMSASENTDALNNVSIQDAVAPLSIADVEAGGTDDWVAILITGAGGLAAVGAYLWFSRKRTADQP